MKNKWNIIVNKYKENKHESEEKIQQVWVELFADSELFGYSKMFNINNHRPLPMGTKTVIPDIILHMENKDICVIELKRHDMVFDKKHETQLMSYLKQISCNVGLLICDKIYMYYIDFINHNKTINWSIDFEEDSSDGISFMELFIKSNFDTLKIKEFIENKNESLKKINEIQKLVTQDYVTQLVKDTLIAQYGEFSTNAALENYTFKVEPKLIPVVTTPINKQHHTHSTPLPNNKLGKHDALKKLNEMGYKNIYNNNTTYACCNANFGYYPSNVAPVRFDNDLYFILDDHIEKKCHLFKIAAKTYDINYFTNIKYDGSAIIYIKYLDPTFKDIHSNLCLKPYHIITFDY